MLIRICSSCTLIQIFNLIINKISASILKIFLPIVKLFLENVVILQVKLNAFAFTLYFISSNLMNAIQLRST